MWGRVVEFWQWGTRSHTNTVVALHHCKAWLGPLPWKSWGEMKYLVHFWLLFCQNQSKPADFRTSAAIENADFYKQMSWKTIHVEVHEPY